MKLWIGQVICCILASIRKWMGALRALTSTMLLWITKKALQGGVAKAAIML